MTFHEKVDRHVTYALQNKRAVFDEMTLIKPKRDVASILAQMAKTDPIAKAKFGLSDRDFAKFCWQVLHGKRRTAFKDAVRLRYITMKLKDEL